MCDVTIRGAITSTAAMAVPTALPVLSRWTTASADNASGRSTDPVRRRAD